MLPQGEESLIAVYVIFGRFNNKNGFQIQALVAHLLPPTGKDRERQVELSTNFLSGARFMQMAWLLILLYFRRFIFIHLISLVYYHIILFLLIRGA